MRQGFKKNGAGIAVLALAAAGACGAALALRREKEREGRLARQRLDEIRRLEGEKLELNAALRETAKREQGKRDFVANLSHDLRTTINAVLGYAAMAEEALDDREKLTDSLDKLRRSGEHLREILCGTEIDRIERGEELLREEPCAFQTIWNAIHNSFEPILREKHQTLETSFWVPHDCLIADETRIRQMVDCLLENAVAHTPDGGAISVSVREIPSGAPGIVRLETTVSDPGPGIPGDKLAHIFDTPAGERPGGLALVREQALQQGGSLTVRSEPGRGTQVTLVLDHRIAGEARPSAPLAEETDSAEICALAAGKRILLAEDNDLNAELVTEILLGLGFQVERARDGADCVEMLDQAGPGYYNLILMDIQMPNMNGYLAARTIRRMEDRAKRSVPIAALTASTFADDRARAIEQGMDGFIAKPIDVRAMIETLTEILR